MKDILKDNTILKKQAFTTPDGYFDMLKQDLKAGQREQVKSWRLYHIAAAAAFALLVAAGGFFLSQDIEDEFTQEDYIVFSEDMTNTILYGEDEQYADAVTDDDIIEYLIYEDIDINDLY